MKLWICVVNGEENEDLREDERIIADCESAADLLATAEIFREEVDYETDKYFWLEEFNISPDVIADTYDELLEKIQDYGLL